MFVEKLSLFGFKSFNKKVTLEFNSGNIASIIGPNGCGKSNVVDAIRWVLGEQSTKQLRGAKMEDVIFNGTREEKPEFSRFRVSQSAFSQYDLGRHGGRDHL